MKILQKNVAAVDSLNDSMEQVSSLEPGGKRTVRWTFFSNVRMDSHLQPVPTSTENRKDHLARRYEVTLADASSKRREISH